MDDKNFDQWLESKYSRLNESLNYAIDVDERLQQVLKVASLRQALEFDSRHRNFLIKTKVNPGARKLLARTRTLSLVAALVATFLIPTISKLGPHSEARTENTLHRHSWNNYFIDFSRTCANPSLDPTCLAQAKSALQLAEQDSNNDTTLQTRLREHSSSKNDPIGKGPWPFVVLGTENDGLYARPVQSTEGPKSADGPEVGIALNHSIVWAECYLQNDYYPAGLDRRKNVISIWLKIHWKNQIFPKSQGISDPAEPQEAWMYRGYLEPLQQNGRIANCKYSEN